MCRNTTDVPLSKIRAYHESPYWIGTFFGYRIGQVYTYWQNKTRLHTTIKVAPVVRVADSDSLLVCWTTQSCTNGQILLVTINKYILLFKSPVGWGRKKRILPRQPLPVLKGNLEQAMGNTGKLKPPNRNLPSKLLVGIRSSRCLILLTAFSGRTNYVRLEIITLVYNWLKLKPPQQQQLPSNNYMENYNTITHAHIFVSFILYRSVNTNQCNKTNYRCQSHFPNDVYEPNIILRAAVYLLGR